MLSGIVQIADINDFISPSQNCAKPIISSDSKNIVKLTLADCLACNGCITSAETILLSEYSLSKHETLSKNKLSFLLISNQSLENLSHTYKIPYQKCLKILREKLNTTFIFFINEFILHTLQLVYDEFLNKKKCLISSECPGWICYAEKKIGKASFEYLSKLKSPQQIFSIYLREFIKKINKNITDDDIYICTIAPCYDKKIEAVRSKNEVNCVISTNELKDYFTDDVISMIEDENKKINNIFTLHNFLLFFDQYFSNAKSKDEILLNVKLDLNTFINNNESYDYPIYLSDDNFSSNYYAEYIVYRTIIKYPNYKVEKKPGKNKDIYEIIILNENNEIYLSLCLAYGFRNIQNIVRKIKQNQLKYDYIELMACPGGCFNGGGQIRENDQKGSGRILIENIKNKLKENNKGKKFEQLELYMDINKELVKYDVNISKDKIYRQFNVIEYSMSDLQW